MPPPSPFASPFASPANGVASPASNASPHPMLPTIREASGGEASSSLNGGAVRGGGEGVDAPLAALRLEEGGPHDSAEMGGGGGGGSGKGMRGSGGGSSRRSDAALVDSVGEGAGGRDGRSSGSSGGGN